MIFFGEHTHEVPITCYAGVDLTIGKFCSIASGLKIVSGKHPIIEHPELISQYPFKEEFGWDYPASKMDGFVTIGNDVWVGEDVTIMEGVIIGDGAILGAKSVIGKDVPPYVTVVGNPAQIIKVRPIPEDAWWDWPLAQIKNFMETR